MSSTSKISGAPIAAVTGRSSSPRRVSSASKSQVDELSADVGVKTEIDTKQPEDFYDGGFGNSGNAPEKENEEALFAEENVTTNIPEAVEATGVLEQNALPHFEAARSVGIYETNMNMLDDEAGISHTLRPVLS